MLLSIPSLLVPGALDRNSTTTGKIILSGEYAVAFGYPGLAVPSPLGLRATFSEDASLDAIHLLWDAPKEWIAYAHDIIDRCTAMRHVPAGTLSITHTIPLGKGMGSSTALIISIAGVLLDTHYKQPAIDIEDALNPGHSGIDFAVIWENAPVYFTKGSDPKILDSHIDLHGALLIDTGTPDQQTHELLAWVSERKDSLHSALETIGNCTERLVKGEDLHTVMKDHHRAQVELGVVTDEAKNLITKIEQEGGSAKVIGAGSRSGGCGIILVVGIDAKSVPSQYPVITL